MRSTTRSTRSLPPGSTTSSAAITSHMVESIDAASPTSRQQTSLDLDNGTFSPASADGATHSDLPESLTTPTSGPAPVRVSPSRPRARGAERATLDIFGRHGSHSSVSVALQSSLESRLRVPMDSCGSTLFSLTWNDVVTPSGRRILARLASVRRTPGTDSTSWPTPTRAASGNGYTYSRGNHDERCLTLTGAARTALPLTNWLTATATDHKRGIADAGRASRKAGGPSLSEAAGWATSTPGAQASGSTAATASAVSSQLNPRFSLWLMGYPTEWASCGEAVTRSSHKSQRRSLKPQSE